MGFLVWKTRGLLLVRAPASLCGSGCSTIRYVMVRANGWAAHLDDTVKRICPPAWTKPALRLFSDSSAAHHTTARMPSPHVKTRGPTSLPRVGTKEVFPHSWNNLPLSSCRISDMRALTRTPKKHDPTTLTKQLDSFIDSFSNAHIPWEVTTVFLDRNLSL
jgi:hypothetical protein